MNGTPPGGKSGESSISDPFAALLLERYGKREPPPEAYPHLPQRLGKYELIEEIGRGGMGIIYKAREAGLDRCVAVKTILAGDQASEGDVRRFREEAMAAARLEHPGIVPVLESGRFGGHWYIAMKLLEGGSLAARLDSYPGKPRAGAELLEILSRAVHFAHQRGVIHRDLKPANVVFDGAGRPHITDFGLSKRLEDAATITASGAVVGTLRYMAPELAGGRREDLTTAVDVYGLGAILYEVLTGAPPFQGEASAELLSRILAEEPLPPSRLAPSVPRDLETICLKCLEKGPERRYGSPGDLADDLGRFLRDEPIAARPVGPLSRCAKWARRRPAAAAFLLSVTLVLIALPIAVLWHDAQLGERAREATEQAARGRRYVYAARLNLAFEAWRRKLFSRTRALLDSLRPAPGQEDLRDFGWRHLDRLAHPERRSFTAHAHRIDALRFIDGGGWLLTAALDGGVKLWDAAGGRLLSEFPGERGPDLFPCISPDGKSTAQIRYQAPEGSWSLRVVELVSQGTGFTWRARVLSAGSGFSSVCFSPGGEKLLAATREGKLSVWTTADWKEVEHAVREPSIGLSYNGSCSPRGSEVAACAGGAILILDATTLAEMSRLTSPAGYTHLTAFSPDGRLLAALRRDGRVEIFEAATWRLKDVLPTSGNGVLAFSADGKLLALGSNVEDEVPALEVWRVENSALERRLISHASSVSAVAFAPDGITLATSCGAGIVKVWRLSDPPEPVRFETSEECYYGLAASSDGRWVVARRRDFVLDVLEVEPRGRGVAPVLRGTLRWDGDRTCDALSPDGRRAALALRGGPLAVYRLELDPPAPRAAEEAKLDTGGQQLVSLGFSEDGGTLLAAGEDGRLMLWRREERPRVEWGPAGAAFAAKAAKASDLVLSPDGATVAVVAERSPVVSLWDVASGSLLADLLAHGDWVISFAYTRDSRWLLTGGLDARICLWDVARIRERRLERKEPVAHVGPAKVLTGHSRAVASLTLFPGGDLLASGSDDRTIKLWDLITGEERGTLIGHRLHVNALAFVRGGELLVSAGGRKAAFGDLVFWLSGRSGRGDSSSE